jgi:hypothetical protein
MLLVTSLLVPLAVPHPADNDALCVDFGWSSDPRSDRVGPAGSIQPPEHCAVCHTLRSYRTALADIGRAGVVLTCGRAIDDMIARSHRAPAFDRLPARAPPA